MALNYKRVDLD